MQDATIDPLFQVHTLNDQGKQRANAIAHLFTVLVRDLECLGGVFGREGAIVKTKLEEACFFAKKSMASAPANQWMDFYCPSCRLDGVTFHSPEDAAEKKTALALGAPCPVCGIVPEAK